MYLYIYTLHIYNVYTHVCLVLVKDLFFFFSSSRLLNSGALLSHISFHVKFQSLDTSMEIANICVCDFKQFCV